MIPLCLNRDTFGDLVVYKFSLTELTWMQKSLTRFRDVVNILNSEEKPG